MRIALIEYRYYADSTEDFYTEQLRNLVSRRILVTNQAVNNIDAKTVVLNHTNQGKDIGAKLIGIDFLIKTNEEFDVLVMVHDKKSLHSPLGNYWGRELKKIVGDAYLPVFIKAMKKRNVGICCASNYIKSEFDKPSGKFNTVNNDILFELIQKYKLRPSPSFEFVAGTIFGCKWAPIKVFFINNPPLQIRKTLERGNVQDNRKGSYTHSWERMLSWVITSGGYSVKGI